MRFSLFRRAPSARALINLCKTALQIAILWPLALAFVPLLLREAERRIGFNGFEPQRVMGPILLLLFSFGGLASAWVLVRKGEGTPLPMATTRRLVVAGPYRHLRNPMALTGVGQMVSVGLSLGSPSVLVYAVVGALLWNFLMRPAEESDMVRHFGADFEHYRRHVPCWIPRVNPLSPGYRSLTDVTLDPCRKGIFCRARIGRHRGRGE